jgi:hypothetical protein
LAFAFFIAYPDNEASDMTENLSPIQAIPDSVLSTFELPLRRTFYPYGYPLALETNSPDVIQAAEEGWGAFEQMFVEEPVRVCLGVVEGDSESPLPPSVTRAREHLMSIVAGPENFMLCDFGRGFAFGWVTRATAADHPLLRYQFLTAGGATLVEQRALAPLHGALVTRNGAGVMLCGDSFAGKSTLAYACARAGWTYVSDDAAFLMRQRDDRYVIGEPYGIRFRTDAPDLFGELADHLPTVRPNGKIAIEVLTSDLGITTAPGCVVDHIVFLDRRPGPPSIRRYPEDRAREDWARFACLGTETVRAAQRRCHERLLRGPLWKLQYAGLDDAVARLERLVDRGA